MLNGEGRFQKGEEGVVVHELVMAGVRGVAADESGDAVQCAVRRDGDSWSDEPEAEQKGEDCSGQAAKQGADLATVEEEDEKDGGVDFE